MCSSTYNKKTCEVNGKIEKNHMQFLDGKKIN